MALFVGWRTVIFDAKGGFIGTPMVALTLEAEELLAIGDSFNFRRAGAKRRFKIFFKEIVGLSHMTVGVDDEDSVLRHNHLVRFVCTEPDIRLQPCWVAFIATAKRPR